MAVRILAEENGAGHGNRTHVSSLEGWRSAAEPGPLERGLYWQGMRESNPRLRIWRPPCCRCTNPLLE